MTPISVLLNNTTETRYSCPTTPQASNKHVHYCPRPLRFMNPFLFASISLPSLDVDVFFPADIIQYFTGKVRVGALLNYIKIAMIALSVMKGEGNDYSMFISYVYKHCSAKSFSIL